MKTIYMTLLVAMALVAIAGFAQERSVGGSHEVQASFSALKAAIQNTDVIARGADTIAREAKNDVAKLEVCGKKGRFYNDTLPANKLDGDKCALDSSLRDDEDESKKASLLEKDFDSSDKIDFPKQANMMLDFSCNAVSEGKVDTTWRPLGEGRQEIVSYCKNTKDKDWSIEFGVGANGWKTVYNGVAKSRGSSPSTQCVSVRNVTRHMFVSDGNLYSGVVIVTPIGTRVVNRTLVMSASNWNGKLRFKNCGGVAQATYYNK